MASSAADITIGPCGSDEIEDALSLVFTSIPAAERTAMVNHLAETAARDGIDTQGLLVARYEDQVVGSTWAQLQAGKTGLLWPPGVAAIDDRRAVSRKLLQAANHHFAIADVAIAQVVSKNCPADARILLEEAGYATLTELLYLARETQSASLLPDSPLSFEPFDPDHPERLAAVIEATYRESLDCPGLGGARAIEDVIAGYRATGVFSPDRWLIATSPNEDVGVLLLTDHPATDSWELIYMGVAPEFRGRGWGNVIVQHAIAIASYFGRARLVLAVDVDNQPAIDVYQAHDFVPWDRREILLKRFATADG